MAMAFIASRAARAAREAMNAIAMSYGGTKAPLATFIRGPVLGLIARIARAFAPIDIEAFLRYHFRKVGDQTRFMLSEFTKAANQHDLDHTALDQLRERLGDTPL
jgi:2-dehydropantoate 2-reductase